MFEALQTVPALPQDFTGENLCADVHDSPDRKYLYASNRGHDSIGCFFIDQDTGQLIKTGHEVEISMPVCLKFAYLE